MKITSVIVASLGVPSLVSAASCNNNCGRAVAGTARQSPPFAARQSLCQAFVSTTVTLTPGAVTVTANPVARRNVHAPRQAAPIITGAVPAYASACADAAAYWSACQCFSGISPTTVTVTAATPVVTVTRGVQSSSVAQSSSSFVTVTQVSSSTRTSTIRSTVLSSVESSAETSSTVASSTEASTTAASSTEASPTEASSTNTSSSTELIVIETPSSTSATPVDSSSSTTPTVDSTIVSIGSTCTPTPVLPSPTPLISSGDDLFARALLPFPIGVFGSYETIVYVSSNGFLSLDGGSTNYVNQPLPSNIIPDVSILPFWDDLTITPPDQAVSYQVFGSTAGSRSVTFEWVTGHYSQPGEFYHFTATFEEAQPGIVTYRYYTTTDKGQSATIGVQNVRNGNSSYIQYSYNSLGSVQDRTFLRLDTTGAGNITTGAFETSEC